MSTRHTVPTTFANLTLGRPFATAFDAEPTHVKASSVHARRVPRPLAPAAPAESFEPDALVYDVTDVDARYFDVAVVFDDGRAGDGVIALASTFDEALTVACDAVVGPRRGRGPHAVAAVIVDRAQPDTMLRTRIVDLRVVRPHACDEGCTGCPTCYAATGTTRCTVVCPHAPAAPDADDAPAPRAVVSVEFFAREEAGRAGQSRRYDIVESSTHDDGTTCERVVEGGFFALSAADDAAREYQRDHEREARRHAAAKTGGAK
jgi:hypothetical protein